MMTEYNNEHGADRDLLMIGYGYSINSELMSLVAKWGGGSFSFIPDPGFVGTVISHALANSMEVSIKEESKEDETGRLSFVNCLDSICLSLVTPKSRYGTISVKDDQLVEARKVYDYYTTFNPNTKYQEPEISIALNSVENWSKWGCHYVRSLSFAHRNKECNNFKDPSVQGYQHLRKKRWSVIRDSAHESYKNLPAPEPTSSTVTDSTPRLATLSRYSQFDSGCLHEGALVELSNGKMLSCAVISKGTVVKVYNPFNDKYYTDKIQCVVRTECGESNFSSIVSTTFATPLHITPWHPVFFSGDWYFPANFAKLTKLKSKYVYSFVLENRSAGMMIAGYPCISLASGLKGEVSGHNFWGTERVVNDLKVSYFDEWENGLVTLKRNHIVRNENGVVCGIGKGFY